VVAELEAALANCEDQHPKRIRVLGTRSKRWRTGRSIRVNRAAKVSPV
jgi:hypothetical protein